MPESAVPDRARPNSRRIYETLREEILTVSLRPGQAISEARMAEQLGVSRTPVREVFRRLADEGLLRVVPQVGTFVAPIQLDSVYDSQFVRETLECRTVAMAAEQATEVDRRKLDRFLVEQSRAIADGQHRRFFRSDDAMHAYLVRMAGHPAVWNWIQDAKAQLDRVRCLSLESEAWLTMIFEQHGEIVARVSAGDPDGAAEAMRRHLRTVLGAVERIASTHGEMFEKPSVTRVERRAG